MSSPGNCVFHRCPRYGYKRLKLQFFLGCSPSQQKENKFVSLSKSPLKKRACHASSHAPVARTDAESTFRPSKKCLSFGATMAKTYSEEDEPVDKREFGEESTSQRYENVRATCRSEISTPFERYTKKIQDQIRAKENEIDGVEEKLSAFQERITFVKSQQGRGNVCHNCHLRLNHTARTCLFDQCTSIFQCGEEKFHPNENAAKQYRQSLNKLRNEKDQLQKDLENKMRASEKVKSSIHSRIENELLQENNEAYHESGIKNWTLLRKHVYAMQYYIKNILMAKFLQSTRLLTHFEMLLMNFHPQKQHNRLDIKQNLGNIASLLVNVL